MRPVFTIMWDQVQSTAQQLDHWWRTLSLDPTTWVPFTWGVLALVVVIVLYLLLRPRRRSGARRPELLISHGEIRVTDAAPSVSASLQAPVRGAYTLSMTVSNLSAVPVQLLELAVRTNASPAPTTAEVPAVLPPHGAVDVSADLREAGGDEGTLELFVYVPEMPPKTFRVRAGLLWEPWNARFRVLPLDQKVEPARGLADRVRRRDRGGWEQQQRAQQRAAVDQRIHRARFPVAGRDEPVRFEPQPGSERPRAGLESWPGGAADLAPSERLAGFATPAAGESEGPAEEPSQPVWPPRRSRPEGSPFERPVRAGAPVDRDGRGGAAARAGDPVRGPGRGNEPATGSEDARRRELERREGERVEAERREAARRETERQEAERARARRLEAERREAERRAAERVEAERLRVEREEAERQQAARREGERVEAERREAARRDAERVEAERARARRLAAERVEAERREAARRDAERVEAERREAERRAAERRAAEQDRSRREAERRAAERAEGERLRAERAKAERRVAERLAAERREGAAVAAGQESAPDAAGADQGEPGAVSPDGAAQGPARPTEAEPGQEPLRGFWTRRPRRAEGDEGGPVADEGGEDASDEKPDRPRLEFPDEF